MVAIFVALMFLGFVLTDLLLGRIAARRAAAAMPLEPLSSILAPPGGAAASRWELPEGVYVAGGHSGLRPEASGGVTLGADKFLGYAWGNVRSAILPRVGARVKKGDPLFHLALDGGIVTVTAPVDGKVSRLNHRLRERPELVTEQPYGAGWACTVLPDRPGSALSSLLSGPQAVAWLGREFQRFCDFVSGVANYDLALGATSPDGGLPAPGCLAYLDPGASAAFEKQFLRP